LLDAIIILDSFIFCLGIIIYSYINSLTPVSIRTTLLNAGNPILFTCFFVIVVPTNTAAFRSFQSTPTVVNTLSTSRELNPTNTRGCTINVAILIFHVHHSPRFTSG